MIRENKKTLIWGSVVTLLPIPIQLLLGRDFGMSIFLPLIFLVTYWLCVFITARDPKQKNQGKKPLMLIFWLIPVLSLFLCAMDYALKNRTGFPIINSFCLLFGIMFMAIGNYLPKIRQNYTLGIKVCWAYTSEENWNATHRFGGKVWFIGGLICALATFLPGTWAIPVFIAALLVLIPLPILYSYFYYRRQKKNGDTLQPIPKLASTKYGKYTLVIFAVLLIFMGCVLFTGNISYDFREDGFTVEASYYDDMTISYEDIEEISYYPGNYPGVRVWGYGSLRLLMGTFQTEDTQYTRYTYYRPDSAVVLTVQGKPLVISGKDPAETKDIYNTLLQKTGK